MSAATADLAPYQDPELVQRVLHNARTVAVVGLSANELRASNFVGYYLQRHGYRMVPVNPRETEILGQPSYPGLRQARDALGERIDVVDVFRAPSALPGIVEDSIAIGASALWCQFGVIDLDAARTATEAGIDVVMDRCMKVEHARYIGRMHWLGFNTQRITAVRGGIQ